MDQFYWICPAACSYTNDNDISRAVFGDQGWIHHKGIVMWGIVHRDIVGNTYAPALVSTYDLGVGGAMPAFASVAVPLPGDVIAIPALVVIAVVLLGDVSTLVAAAVLRVAVEQMAEAVAMNRLGDGG